MFVTLGTYTNHTNPAKQFAKNRPNLRLVDGDDLVKLILTHYEAFDSRYKGVLPLKRVYVADPKEESVVEA